ncbi:bifunctional methylthioribulose-1-phosphate dehydratase/enolase-phosphatase E1 [Spatholobus suberectus]|nr:bifunctional methylthioribulose-1-phosphate dehydratase/enolase-phosphatase E1 [Spatholobus suberectus]
MAAAADSVASQAYLEGKAVKETRALISELCRHFYSLGWVSGTGGSITIKVHDDSIPKPTNLFSYPLQVFRRKEWNQRTCMCYPTVDQSCLLHLPNLTRINLPSVLIVVHFMKAYEMCDAGAVIHSHGIESCLVTMFNPLAREFQITHMEMIKGIKGHGYYDELVVPII